jgi:hypothetical protein
VVYDKSLAAVRADEEATFDEPSKSSPSSCSEAFSPEIETSPRRRR